MHSLRHCLFAAFMAALPAVAGASDTAPATIPQVVLPAPELSDYAATLAHPGVNARLSGKGPMTALVPRNQPHRSGWDGPVWPTDPNEAARAAQALVIAGSWTPETLRSAAQNNSNRLVLSTQTGASLIVAPTASGRLLVVDHHGNTSRVVGPARPAGNGAVIVLDRPLASR